MLKINKKVEYALMAIKYIASKNLNDLTNVRELVDAFHIPFDTVSKVLQTLTSVGMVESVQGIKGGYRLIRPLKSISYRELEAAIEGKTSNLACVVNKECSLQSYCNIISPVKTLEEKVNRYLEELDLEELLFSDSKEELKAISL